MDEIKKKKKEEGSKEGRRSEEYKQRIHNKE